MPQFCAAFGCSNNSSKESCRENMVSFHNFPHDNPSLLKTWLVKMKRDSFVPSRNSKLCSVHFLEHCFDYQNFTNRRMIKKDAVPTEFCFTKQTKSPRRRTSYSIGNVDQAENDVPTQEEPTTQTVGTQTDICFASLLEELDKKNKEIEMLKSEAEKRFSPADMTDSEVKSFTGHDKENFNKIYMFLNLEEDLSERQQSKLSPMKQYFMFLIKLRTGVTMEFLAYIFQVSLVTVSRTFNYLVTLIYDKVKSVPIWPSREQIDEFMPPEFKKKYPHCRVIIDCVEFEVQKPFNPSNQQMTFSHYKNRNTAKGLIGIAPSGGITFISELWTGSVSDKMLFCSSCLLQLLKPGDTVLADKGFRIEEELVKANCKLAQPLFLTKKVQFTLEERAENKKVSHLRVHVERAISRIKNYKYFEGQIPYHLFHNLNQVFYIVSFLTNFNPPLIKISPVVFTSDLDSD